MLNRPPHNIITAPLCYNVNHKLNKLNAKVFILKKKVKINLVKIRLSFNGTLSTIIIMSQNQILNLLYLKNYLHIFQVFKLLLH